MKQYVIIAAGGIGSRMGGNTPKQLLLLLQKPVIIHTIERFKNALPEAEIIIPAPIDFIEELKELVAQYNLTCMVIEGGNTRYQSVKNALNIVSADGVVLVHDAARCLVEEDLIINCYTQAIEKAAVIPVIACTDSVRWVTATENKVLNRGNINLVQTPQAFSTSLLKAAFELPYQDNFTDEAAVMEAAGHAVHLIEGNLQNIKITHPIDLEIAALYLAQRK